MIDITLSRQYSDDIVMAVGTEPQTKEFLLALIYLMHTTMATTGVGADLQEQVLDIGRSIVRMEAVDEL